MSKYKRPTPNEFFLSTADIETIKTALGIVPTLDIDYVGLEEAQFSFLASSILTKISFNDLSFTLAENNYILFALYKLQEVIDGEWETPAETKSKCVNHMFSVSSLIARLEAVLLDD